MSIFKKSALRLIFLTCLPLSLTTACALDGTENETVAEGGKTDRWNGANDPSNMGKNYIYNWDELNVPELQEGASEIVPWPDTYWPMQDDGYNNRWQGDDKLSPMELYDKTFHGWTPSMGFKDFLKLTKFSYPGEEYDADYYQNMGPATAWAHKGGNERGRVLTEPDGTSKWDEESEEDDADWGGLQSWFGHCHAWAPAAFTYPEPKHAVTYQGETFEVADIKALAEATLEGGRSMFLGGRCNAEEAKRDDHGRIIATECRDTNAGAFHVVTLNRMGIRKSSFVIDATYDFEVWNQPVRDYEITMQKEVELEEALELIGRTEVEEYPYSDATRFVHVNMDFRYIIEGDASPFPYLDKVDSYTRTHDYNYLLELDDDANIIGGEWIDDAPHPDFIWAPYGAHDVRNRWSSEIIIKQSEVQKLVDLSILEEAEPSNGVVYESTPNKNIPDNNKKGLKDYILVPESSIIKGIQIDLDIGHANRGDLKVTIRHGRKWTTLIANEGEGDSDIVQTFHTDHFDGYNGQGLWTLKVVDNAASNTGTLNSWTLIIKE